MIPVLENVRDREQVSSGDEELHLAGEEIGQEEEFSELEITPPKREFELGEDSLNLYFAEVGQTPLLNAEETKVLSRQIEDGKHLVRLEEDWIAKHGAQPSAIDLLLALAERLSQARSLFETLYQYLELPAHGSIAEKVSHPDLRRAIDSKIDQHLSSAIAEITGVSQTRIEESVIALSLDSRLIPWHIMEEAGQKSSLAAFGKMLQSPEMWLVAWRAPSLICSKCWTISERCTSSLSRNSGDCSIFPNAARELFWPASSMITPGNQPHDSSQFAPGGKRGQGTYWLECASA